MDDVDLARRALSLLDLTELGDTATEADIQALCAKALAPLGAPAAICVWPQHVALSRQFIGEASVKIATVANFPAGDGDLERVIEDVTESLVDGADEIDLVLPYRAFLAGQDDAACEMLMAVRQVVDGDRLMKVILETGALTDFATIERASRLAIDCGADFIKTSTGKIPVSATLPAARVMLNAIRTSGRKVGFKPSGGIRSLKDAGAYLALADEIMGPDWATPATFRIGASSLYGAIAAALGGTDPGKAGAY